MSKDSKKLLKSFLRTLCVVVLFMANVATASGCIYHAKEEPFYYVSAIITILSSSILLGIDTKKHFLYNRE